MVHERDRAYGAGVQGHGAECGRVQATLNLGAEKCGWALQTAVGVRVRPGLQKQRGHRDPVRRCMEFPNLGVETRLWNAQGGRAAQVKRAGTGRQERFAVNELIAPIRVPREPLQQLRGEREPHDSAQ